MFSRRSLDGGRRVVVDSVRMAYTDHLRRPLAAGLFDHLGVPLVTRQLLYDDPPGYVDEFVEIDEPEVVTIDPPDHVGPVPSSLREVIREWEFVRPFVAVLRDVDLVGPHALPVAPDHAYVIEAADGSALRVTDELVRAIGSGTVPVHRGTGNEWDTAVSFAGPWSSEFFHWFADYLPRMRVLERYERETGASPPIVVPSNPPGWLVESLDVLGVPRERRIRWPGGRRTVRRLVVPSMPRHTRTTAPPEGYVHSPRELGWVRDRLLDGVDLDNRPDVGDRLYVSRSRQPTRRVRNEDVLLSIASTFGFEKVQPEDWTLREQIAAFANAEAVLGPHGAGLLNVIYGRSTRLIELFGGRTNPCFFAIAEVMDVPYAMMQCDPVGDDLRVDPSRLKELLSLVLE